DNTIEIREERPDDYGGIHDLLIEAFRDMPMSDHREHILVNRLRKTEDYVRELALVAVANENPVGFVMLTRCRIVGREATEDALFLAPLAVHPFFQNYGIGTHLMESAHVRAAELGYNAVVLMGYPEYYRRFGYQLASEYGIVFPPG